MTQTAINCKCDTYIRNETSNDYRFQSFDGEKSMRVRQLKSSSIYKISMLQFDIPTFPNKEITKATLRVFCMGSGNNEIRADMYNIRESVSSMTAQKFNNTYSSSFVASSADTFKTDTNVSSYNQWITFDITNIIKNNTGISNLTMCLICIKTTTNANMDSLFGTMEGGYTSQIIVEHVPARPSIPTIVYPNGDIVEKEGTIKFQWVYHSVYDTGQAKFDLEWRMQSSTTWESITQTTSNEFYEMGMDAFSIGIVEWRVRTYNVNDSASDWAYGSFETIGRPDMPILVGMKNDAITEITWKCKEIENALFELEIYQDGQLIHASGKQPGMTKNSYIPNQMFENGTYIVKLRIGSVYDKWSDVSSKVFTIDAPVPSRPDIGVSAMGLGIRVWTDTETEVFVFRSEAGGAFMPMARLEPGLRIFDDYTVKSNVKYTYYVRAHDGSYSDSKKIDVRTRYTGYILADVEHRDNCVNLFLSTTDFFNETTVKASNTSELVNYIGREYPVKESGIYKNKLISMEYYLPEEQYKTLEAMYNRNGIYILRNHDECVCCDITSFSSANAYFDKGRNVSLQFSVLNYSLEVRFDDQSGTAGIQT